MSDINEQEFNNLITCDRVTIKEDNSVSSKQLDILDISKDNLINEIKSIDILNLTPMDGFNKLYDIIKKANNI